MGTQHPKAFSLVKPWLQDISLKSPRVKSAWACPARLKWAQKRADGWWSSSSVWLSPPAPPPSMDSAEVPCMKEPMCLRLSACLPGKLVGWTDVITGSVLRAAQYSAHRQFLHCQSSVARSFWTWGRWRRGCGTCQKPQTSSF